MMNDERFLVTAATSLRNGEREDFGDNSILRVNKSCHSERSEGSPRNCIRQEIFHFVQNDNIWNEECAYLIHLDLSRFHLFILLTIKIACFWQNRRKGS